MENATKALLIAGAVLLVIMIISVGLMIFNSANGQIEGAISQMNQQEKDQFNQKFLGYEGTQKSGSTVKTLISTVISSNEQMTIEGTEEKHITMSFGTDTDKKTSDDLNAIRQKIVSGRKYKVDVNIGSGGLVSSITITDESTQSS